MLFKVLYIVLVLKYHGDWGLGIGVLGFGGGGG